MSATGDDDTLPSRSGPSLRAPRPQALDRYESTHEIARGGMGRVVAAFDRELDRHVAVKEALTDDADTLRRFAREIWITARLEHPAIVPIYDAGTRSDGTPFYVMRKITGEPLVALVEAAATFEERLALVPHVLAAARAIAHAHQRRVVHRDLKPGNILVGELGETVVIDWGLAKVVGELDDTVAVDARPSTDAIATRAGSVIGTPGFMPPEQAAGGEIDLRTDVYALGATLYYVLSRRLPHDHAATEELLHAIVHAPATPIAQLVPELPRDLAAIVDIAISPDPDRRYADAGVFAAELDSFLAGRLIASRRYSRRERLARFLARHRVAVIAVTLAALALVIGGAFAFDRVLTARGRAEGALAEAVREREIAQDTIATMTLDRARSIVEANPTAAVALVRPLATGARWREARAVVAEAEARGVAISLPGPMVPARLAIAPVAAYAAAAGSDGRTWLYDLAARTAVELGRFAAAHVELKFLDDRTLAIAEPAQTTLLDLAGGARRVLPVGGIVVGDAGHLVAQDAGGKVVDVELATGTVRPLGAFAPDASALTMSPGGTWVTARTPTGIAIVARATGAVAHELAVDSPAVAWDAERGDRFVVRGRRELTLVTLTGATLERRSHAFNDLGFATIARGEICVGGLRAMGMLPASESERDALRPLAESLGFVATGAHGLCYGLAATRIAIAGDGPRRELVSPIALMRLAASPRNPYVVAAGRDRIVAWRVPAPARRFVERGATSIIPAGPHGVIVGGLTWRHLDLATGRSIDLPVTGLCQIASDPAGRLATCLEPERDGLAPLTIIDLRAPRATTLTVDVAVLAVADRVAYGSRDGTVSTVDAAGVATVEVRGAAAPAALHVAPGALAVAWADRKIWVRDAHGVRTRTHGVDVRGVHVTPTGSVIVVGRASIEEWHLDGRTATLAVPSREIVEVWWGDLESDGRQLFVQLADATLARLDLDTRGEHRLAVLQKSVSIAATAARAVIGGNEGVQVLDLAAGVGWNLRMASWPLPAVVSNDGRWVVGFADDAVRALPIDVPETPAALATRIDALTNAEIDATIPSSVVRWRD